MKNEFLNSKNIKTLSKNTQRSINGGLGSSNCTLTGCFSSYPSGGQGFVGLEGGPCALETPTGENCIGTTRNGECCIGY